MNNSIIIQLATNHTIIQKVDNSVVVEKVKIRELLVFITPVQAVTVEEVE